MAGLQGPQTSSVPKLPLGPRLTGTGLSQPSESNNHAPRPTVRPLVGDGTRPPDCSVYYPEATPVRPATGGGSPANLSRLSLDTRQPWRTTNSFSFDSDLSDTEDGVAALAEAHRRLRQILPIPPRSSGFRAWPGDLSAASGLPNDRVDATDGGSTSNLNTHTRDWGNIRRAQVAQNRHLLQAPKANRTSASAEHDGPSPAHPQNIRSPVDDPTLYSDDVESTAQPESDEGDGEEDENVYHTNSNRDRALSRIYDDQVDSAVTVG